MTVSNVEERTVTQARRSNKPALIIMNNAHGQDHPLWPDPVNSVGWRCWKMLHFFTGATQRDYLRCFDRYRMSDERRWSIEDANQYADKFHAVLKGRKRVVVLGVDTLKALGVYHRPQYYRWIDYGFEGMLVPHPSGRNEVYRDPLYTLQTSSLLAELYNEYKHGVL